MIRARAPGLLRRIWSSAYPGPLVPRSDRERALVTIHTLLIHLRPVRVPARTLRFTHTFGLGGSSLVLIAMLAASGLLLMLGYRPVPADAYDSVVAIERDVIFGGLVRGIHYWSANLLVIVVLLHLARVFLTGGYHGPRQFNWVIGATMLVFVLANAFTGYLLPWDQLAYWAVTISTGMLGYLPGVGPLLQRVARGGSEIGADTLVLFYTLHTSIVPVTLLVLMAFVPHLLLRETAMALAIVACVAVLAASFGAPLGARANPGLSPNPTKAPWYFQGFQELLVHVHPVFAVLVIPLVAGAAFLLLPYLTADGEPAGAWFLSVRGRRAAGAAAALALVATPLAVVARELLFDGGSGSWIQGGATPVTLLFAGLVGVFRLMRRRYGLSLNETVQALVVLLATAFATLTLIGVLFRGEGMALGWPWSV